MSIGQPLYQIIILDMLVCTDRFGMSQIMDLDRVQRGPTKKEYAPLYWWRDMDLLSSGGMLGEDQEITLKKNDKVWKNI